ncbi:MAG: tetrahydromethanopterin S-methyltransferase subunit A [Candidatus Thorarchaeota archaeon]
MGQNRESRKWPPVSGDFEVGNPDLPVAVCTLGKKFDVPAEYGIIGTCKTENIGIERIIVNIVSNPNIRFLILSGPEVPGHHTGASLTSLYSNGVDTETRRIIDASGAIPYIENVPADAVERFRKQVEFINMMNNSDPQAIAARVDALNERNPGRYPEDAIWIDFKGDDRKRTPAALTADVSILPEFGVFYNPETSMIFSQLIDAIISTHPVPIGIEIRAEGKGTILFGREGT